MSTNSIFGIGCFVSIAIGMYLTGGAKAVGGWLIFGGISGLLILLTDNQL